MIILVPMKPLWLICSRAKPPKRSARFVVVAAHIHNYERFEQDGVVYLVSGGGEPLRSRSNELPLTFTKDNSFPNFHYVKFELRAATHSMRRCIGLPT